MQKLWNAVFYGKVPLSFMLASCILMTYESTISQTDISKPSVFAKKMHLVLVWLSLITLILSLIIWVNTMCFPGKILCCIFLNSKPFFSSSVLHCFIFLYNEQYCLISLRVLPTTYFLGRSTHDVESTTLYKNAPSLFEWFFAVRDICFTDELRRNKHKNTQN